MQRFVFSFITLVCATSAWGFSPQTSRIITDELVTNLNCSNLSADSIYKAINKDSFGLERRLKIKNFSTRIFKGHCWAIARSQRINLLLSRKDKTVGYNPAVIDKMVTGLDVANSEVNLNELAKPLSRLQSAINYFAPGFDSNQLRAQFSLYKLIKNLTTFAWPIKEGVEAIHRFKNSLKIAQTRLFMRAQNLQFLYKEQSEQSLLNNLAAIIKLSNQNRLPLINLRLTKSNQHIVVGRSARYARPGEIHINVIDSNAPRNLQTDIIIKQVNPLEVTYLGVPVDVFLVDEKEDRPYLDNALLRHYTRICSMK